MALVMQFVMGFKVGTARVEFKVPAPAITGNVDFERVFRAHQNTMEYMPMYLVFLWLASMTGGNMYWVGLLGLVWILARICYFIEYSKGSKLRWKVFQVTAMCLLLLVLTIVYNLIMM